MLNQDLNFKMQLFFIPELTVKSKQAVLENTESFHLHKVLRKNIGDKITVTNGNKMFFECVILEISKDKCVAKVIKHSIQKPLPYNLHVGISILKSRDRFEWFIEKSCEIGISEITPIICDRTEKRSLNFKRINKILISAMKQSLKSSLPKLNPVLKLKDFVKNRTEDKLLIAHCENSKKNHLIDEIKPGLNNLILIGPEGDFSKSEIALCNSMNFKDISLGNSRLRSETAAVVACHSFSIANM